MQTGVIRRLGIALTATAVFMLAAACGGSDSPSSSADGSGASKAKVLYAEQPTSLPVTEPLTKPAPKDVSVVWVAAQFVQSQQLQAGLSEAAGVLGWNLKTFNYDAANPATIASSIESAIAAKPDVIVLNGLMKADIPGAIAKARAASIPIVLTATPDESENGVYTVLHTGVKDAFSGTQLAANVAAESKDSGTVGHVLQMTVPQVSTYLQPVDEAFEAELADKCPKCTRDLLKIDLADVFNGNAAKQVVSYIQSHPDINYVVPDSSDLGNGLRAALNAAGLNDVKIFGSTVGQAQISELQHGGPGLWTVQSYHVQGWVIADEVLRILVGDPTDLWKDDKSFVYVLSADNADGVDAKDPQFPKGYEDMFKKMWGLS